MNPVAFTLFGLEIRWYGLLMASGMLIASILLQRFAQKKRQQRKLQAARKLARQEQAPTIAIHPERPATPDTEHND